MVKALLQLGTSFPNTILMMAFCIGGLVLLIALALHGESDPPSRRPVDRHGSNPREVLSFQLMRGDISPDEYLDQMVSLNAAVRDA